MIRKSLSSLVVVFAAAACAQGVGTGTDEDDVVEVGGNDAMGGDDGMPGTGGMGGNPTGTGGNPTGTGGNPTGMPGTGGMGGDPGPTCGATEHLCGGICTGNTPATGCYQSVDCTACPNVPNGTATCDANGLCAATCNSPYVPSGNSCICPNQCCTNADCPTSGSTCDNGTCVEPSTCDQALCIALCGLQSKIGVCLGDQCTCI